MQGEELINNEIRKIKDNDIYIYNKDELIKESNLDMIITSLSQNIKVKVFETSDNKVVIINDKTLKILENKKIKLNKLTYDSYMLMLDDISEGQIVLLSDLLKKIRTSVTILIEVLNEGKKCDLLKKIMQDAKTFDNEIIIESKKDSILKFMLKKYPNIKRVKVFETYEEDKVGFLKKNSIKNVKISNSCKIYALEYDINLMPNKKLDVIRRNKNIKVMARLIDTEAKMNKSTVYSDLIVIDKIRLDKDRY